MTIAAEERARINFIKHAFVAEKYGKTPGEYLYPNSSIFMQMAVDDMAYDLTDAYLKEIEERKTNKGPHTYH